MAIAKERDQLAFDETIADDDELRNALETHASRKASRQELALAEKEAKARADALLAKYEITPEQPLRVGRFRIERVVTKGRSVSFETGPSSRLKISTLDDDDQPALRAL